MRNRRQAAISMACSPYCLYSFLHAVKFFRKQKSLCMFFFSSPYAFIFTGVLSCSSGGNFIYAFLLPCFKNLGKKKGHDCFKEKHLCNHSYCRFGSFHNDSFYSMCSFNSFVLCFFCVCIDSAGHLRKVY